ncbi:DUF1656 domain-containing protein [Hyphomicrobium sp.]|uniref:DUF1656 domain-containing protein n=1 Tax=Hyphomicrobium sp. TaxID=82 RepID=UPI000FB13C8A|nr:DUF1656 domain-containing protein [Hyphomicrobium sp.]RUO97513.1 MAG: DUF1656 domain-containing protein [Hyphomicrobium sp.]
MTDEVCVFGVFVPSILPCSIIAYVAVVVISRMLRAIGAYRYVWHRALFNLALFVCFLGASVFLFSKTHL